MPKKKATSAFEKFRDLAQRIVNTPKPFPKDDQRE